MELIFNVGLLFHGVFGLVGRQDIRVGLPMVPVWWWDAVYEVKEVIPIVGLVLHG